MRGRGKRWAAQDSIATVDCMGKHVGVFRRPLLCSFCAGVRVLLRVMVVRMHGILFFVSRTIIVVRSNFVDSNSPTYVLRIFAHVANIRKCMSISENISHATDSSYNAALSVLCVWAIVRGASQIDRTILWVRRYNGSVFR